MAKTDSTMKNDKLKADGIKNADMSYCLPAKDHKTLQNAAYQDFSQNGSEGKTHKIYLDCLGNPTVGVGHLIMPNSGLNKSSVEEAYRQKYLALDLRDANGNLFSSEEKIKQFDAILDAMKKKSFKTTGGVPNYVTEPAVGKLSETGVKYAFNADYDYWYNRVKKKFPDLDKYPLSLQLSLTHCGFAGALNKIKNTGDFVDIAEQVAKVRSSKITSSKEREMAQKAAKECRYLASIGLNPLSSPRENLMSALNVAEPKFAEVTDEPYTEIVDGKPVKVNPSERDNVKQGSVLQGLFANEENEGDVMSEVFAKLMIAMVSAAIGKQASNNPDDARLVEAVKGKPPFGLDVTSENFARDVAQQLTYNINSGYLGYCSAGQQYCAGAGTATLNQVAGEYGIDVGVKGVGCIDVRDKFTKLCGSNGYSKNCYETLKEKIAQNPTTPQVFTLTIKSKHSNSGLHYVTVAPTIDKNGEIVRDGNGTVKYSVYGFNRNVIEDLDTYSGIRKEGNVFPVSEVINQRMQEKEHNVSLTAAMNYRRTSGRS